MKWEENDEVLGSNFGEANKLSDFVPSSILVDRVTGTCVDEK